MNFSNIKARCDQNSLMCERVIDQFLMYYIAYKAGLAKNIDLTEKKYKHIVRDMPKGFFPAASAEFIVGKTLMKNGLLNKYIKDPRINELSVEEQAYLKFQLAHPWRYVFATIVDRPEDEFFVMRDEILGDELLVYSPGIESNCKDGYEHSLYFLLLGNNGECWQSYGLIAPFLSFDIDDIYVYATEVFPEVEDDETFVRSVYKNPFPYFMLLYGQKHPIVMSGKSVLRHYAAEQEITGVDIDKLKEYFNVQWNKGGFSVCLR